MTFSKATDKDIPQMIPLWRGLIDSHAQMERMFMPTGNADEKFTEYLLSLLDKDNYLVAVAGSGSKVVGYVIASVSTTPEVFVIRRRMYLQDMVVDPESRRKGIAKGLMNAVMAFAKEQQVEKIDLLVAVKNEGANKFWKEMGFEPAMNYMNLYLV